MIIFVSDKPLSKDLPFRFFKELYKVRCSTSFWGSEVHDYKSLDEAKNSKDAEAKSILQGMDWMLKNN